MTSSGVAMSVSMGREATIPSTIKIRPPAKPVKSAVCTVSLASRYSPPPQKRATSTFAPTEIPIKKLTSRLMSELVAPTAAMASLPTNRPTTTMSAALNSSCKMPEHMSGKANSRIRLSSGP